MPAIVLICVLCIPQGHPISKFYFASGLQAVKKKKKHEEANFMSEQIKLVKGEGPFYEHPEPPLCFHFNK